MTIIGIMLVVKLRTGKITNILLEIDIIKRKVFGILVAVHISKFIDTMLKIKCLLSYNKTKD